MALRSGSLDLAKQGRRRLIGHWLQQTGFAESDLSCADRARIDYIWGGVTAVISSDDAPTVEDSLVLLQAGIADAVGQLIHRIGEEHGVGL